MRGLTELQPDLRAFEPWTRVILDEERTKRGLAEAVTAADQSTVFPTPVDFPSTLSRLVRGLLEWAITGAVTGNILSTRREITSIIHKRSSLIFPLHNNTIFTREGDII